MYKLVAENQNGETLELTNNPAYVITGIDGLSQPDAIINSIDRAGHNGAMFNSAKVDVRQIILTIVINSPACENRNFLYKFFRSSGRVRLYYYNDMHEVYIDGWVKNASDDFFAKKQIMQVTIDCPDPFFHGVVELQGETNGVQSLFEFPFAIDEPIAFSDQRADHSARIWNPGDSDSGIIIEIRATGAMENPRIYHQNTGEFIRVNTTLQSGDRLIINTNTDEKSIYRYRSGTRTNLIASRTPASSWIGAVPGLNTYNLLGTSGLSNITCQISFRSNLGGV